MPTTSPHFDPDERRAIVIEDVTDLLDKGESGEHIARRLGYTSAKTLARVLEKWGEPSLARRLTRPRQGVWAA